MIKEYKAVVGTCLVCPNYRRLIDRDTALDFCRAAGKLLNTGGLNLDIPSWCPLPDVKNPVLRETA